MAWEADPGSMAADLEVHDQVLRGAIEGHGGFVFSTAGDAFSAAFGVPSEALAAAVAAQRGLGEVGCPLRVRMGVHTGEAVERDGGYFGPALNRTARLMALGHGGQVLVSGTTVGLVSPRRFSFVGLGEHRLKDLSRPEAVSQLTAEGLRSEFPPLRSVVSTGNLPLLGRLFGRDRDVGDLVPRLGGGGLVTLVGAAGIGKTTLAVAAARSVMDDFADGCWLVDLTGLPAGAGFSAVAGAVAEADSRFGSVEALARRELLLVLDNCEHVIGGAAEYLARVLESPGVAVLATSREPLGVDAEQIIRVAPLSTGVSGDGEAGVELFAARALEAGAEIDLDAERDTVVEICEAVRGMPLAIELAAAQAGVMTTAQILQRLGDRLGILRGGSRGPEHHRTMEATVAWSYDLLDPVGQAMLRRLSVFESGFDLVAAEAVSPDLPAPGVVKALAGLVRKSLLNRIGERFSMLESVRQFASTRLGDSERLDAEQRHFEYFSRWAHHIYHREPRFELSTDEITWVSDNLHDLRFAVAWGADHDRPTPAAEIAAVLWPHYYGTGQPTAEDWNAPLLDHLDQLDPQLQIDILHGSAGVLRDMRDLEGSEQAAQAEYRLLQETGLMTRCRGANVPHMTLGILRQRGGDFDGAVAIWREGLIEARKQNAPIDVLAGFIALTLHDYQGKTEEALALLEEVDVGIVEPRGRTFIDGIAAAILLDLGQPDEAWERATQALAPWREAGVQQQIQADILWTMSRAAWDQGDRKLALALLRESLDTAEGSIFERMPTYGPWEHHLVTVLLAGGQPQAALTVLDIDERFSDHYPPAPSAWQAASARLRQQVTAALEQAGQQPLPPAGSPQQMWLVVRTALNAVRFDD